MRFQGSVINEQGVTFGIVVVQFNMLESYNRNKADELIVQCQTSVFPGIPVVLMAQDNRGIPKYYGRKDIVDFLASIDYTRIPWKEYSVS